MVLFNAAELAEFIQFARQRIDNLHALEKFPAAFLVAPIFLILSGVELLSQVVVLVLQRRDISLLRSQLHYFLPKLM